MSLRPHTVTPTCLIWGQKIAKYQNFACRKSILEVLPHSYHSSSWVWHWIGAGRHKIPPGASWGRKEWDPAVAGWPCRADGFWAGPELCFQSHQWAKPGAFLGGRGSWGGVGKITGKGNKNLKILAVGLAGNKEKQTGWRKTFVKSVFLHKNVVVTKPWDGPNVSLSK